MDDMRREFEFGDHKKTPPQPSESAPQCTADTAIAAAVCALLNEQASPTPQTEATQPTEHSTPPLILAAVADLLNDLTNDGLVVWREGRNWCWRWNGSDLIADIDRVGLGDAVLDAVAARNASLLEWSLT